MPTDNPPQTELLTVAQVAEILQVSEATVRRLYSDRLLPYIKIRGGVRFAYEDVISYVAKQRVAAVGPENYER